MDLHIIVPVRHTKGENTGFLTNVVPGNIRVPGIQTVLWQRMLGSLQRQMVACRGKTWGWCQSHLLGLFTAVINTKVFSWSEDHKPPRQQSVGHPVHWCRGPSLCRGVWAERNPPTVPSWPHGDPTAGQCTRLKEHPPSVLLCDGMAHASLCLGCEVLSGRPGCQRWILESGCCPVASRESSQRHGLQHESRCLSFCHS